MSPDRATLWNGALLRYLDFMDNYLAPMQTGHPGDNLAAEYSDASGRDFPASLALGPPDAAGRRHLRRSC